MIFSLSPAAMVRGLKIDPSSKIFSTSGFTKVWRLFILPYELGSKFGKEAMAIIFPVLGSMIIPPPLAGFHDFWTSDNFFSRNDCTFGSSVSTMSYPSSGGEKSDFPRFIKIPPAEREPSTYPVFPRSTSS